MKPFDKIRASLLLLCLGMNAWVFAGVHVTEPQSAAHDLGQAQIQSATGAQAVLESQKIQESTDAVTIEYSDLEGSVNTPDELAITQDAKVADKELIAAADEVDKEIVFATIESPADSEQEEQNPLYFVYGCLIGMMGIVLGYFARS